MLKICDLSIQFASSAMPVVDSVSFTVPTGHTVGLVGESGSGKSLTALALMRLTPPDAVISGQLLWNNEDILTLDDAKLRQLRGAELGMIFQNPLAALNPVYTIGDHLIETIRFHRHVTHEAAKAIAIEWLHRVKITDPETRLHNYPHEFSLGMCQRVMIALTLAMSPKLLIADEPTASLDVTVQADILDLLNTLKHEQQLSMLLISHDMAIVAKRCDWVMVMCAGQLLEQGIPRDIFTNAQHPYTRSLIAAIPKF